MSFAASIFAFLLILTHAHSVQAADGDPIIKRYFRDNFTDALDDVRWYCDEWARLQQIPYQVGFLDEKVGNLS